MKNRMSKFTLLPCVMGLGLVGLFANESSAQYYYNNGGTYYQPVSNAWAQNLFKKTKHNFGTVARAAKTEHVFTFKNTTKETIEIQHIAVSCRCTLPTIETKVVKPGEIGKIRAAFQTRLFVGQRGASLTVSMKKGNNYSSTILRVDGYIRQDVVVHPPSIQFPKVLSANGGKTAVRILYAGRNDWKINKVSSGIKGLKLNLKETKRQHGRVEYLLEADLPKDMPNGQLMGIVNLETNDFNQKSFPVNFYANVVQPIQIRNNVELTIKDGKVIGSKLFLASTEAFKILDYECPSCPVEIKLNEKQKKVHMYRVTTKDASMNMKKGRSEHKLILKTDHPSQPEAVVNVVVNVLAAN